MAAGGAAEVLTKMSKISLVAEMSVSADQGKKADWREGVGRQLRDHFVQHLLSGYVSTCSEDLRVSGYRGEPMEETMKGRFEKLAITMEERFYEAAWSKFSYYNLITEELRNFHVEFMEIKEDRNHIFQLLQLNKQKDVTPETEAEVFEAMKSETAKRAMLVLIKRHKKTAEKFREDAKRCQDLKKSVEKN